MDRRYSEDEEKYFRSMMFPEEDRHRYTSAKWDGSFRWFRAPNILCLEKYRLPPAAPIAHSKPAA
jgi:hypothetical protein